MDYHAIMQIDVLSDMRLKASMRPNVVIANEYCTCFKIDILDITQILNRFQIKLNVYIITNNIELPQEKQEVELRAGKDVIAKGLITKVIYCSSSGWPDF